MVRLLAADELALDGLRSQETDELLVLVSPFKNLVSLVMYDAERGNEEFPHDDGVRSDSGSRSGNGTHKHTMLPGDHRSTYH